MSKRTSAAAAVAADPGKAARVEQERARLMELFTGADSNKMDFIRNQVQQLAWLNISISDLQAETDAAGAVVQYDNGGNQRGLQANPACKLLIEYEKLSNTIFRALLPLVPEKVNEDDFLNYESWQKTPEEIEEEYQAEEERRKRINAEIAAAQKQLEESRAKNGN